MRNYLLFQLYGPLQSWGDVAVGEIRPGAPHPTKSAVIGLLAAALGVKRSQDDIHIRMDQAYGIAVRKDAEGLSFRDFHTVQTASSKKGRAYRCRADLIKGMLDPLEKVHTIVSYRDYLADAYFGICLWVRVDEPPFTLTEISDALTCPVFVPYLGRKSCPVALPFAPTLADAKNAAEALKMLPLDAKLVEVVCPDLGSTRSMSWDIDTDAGVAPTRIEYPRDVPLSRQRWQFSSREECFGAVDAPKRREW